jgi:hypothetical protein
LLLGPPTLLFVLYVAYVIHAMTSLETPYTDKDPLPFTREAWLSGAHDWHGSRFLMIEDLTSKHPLIGMTRTQVLDLLGPMQAGDYPGFGDCYYLGPEDHPFGVDNAWLVLTFENDVLQGWQLATD